MWLLESHQDGIGGKRRQGDSSIGVRANIHLGGQTEFCPNGENNLFVTRPRQGEKIIMNYCSACF